MTDARDVSAAAARRFLVLRHLLAPPRSLPPGTESVMRVFERLGSLQFDPLEVAGRNHDLVLLARIDGYRREHTDELLYVERRLYETYNKGLSLVPTAELPWYRVTWDAYAAGEHARKTFAAQAELVEELLTRIREQGPLSPTDVEAREAIDWFWRPTNVVRAVLEALALAGTLALARRDGNRRVYDLAERLFAAELLAERRPEREQRRHKLLSRHRAHGLLGAGGQQEIWIGTGAGTLRRELHAELLAEGVLVQVRVEGVKGVRHLLADELPLLAEAEAEVAVAEPPGARAPAAAFLAPLDPLVWDRGLLRQLYGFDYVWEVYVPAAKRRWGYYVLPLLFGDRLVGRIEPRLDRRTGVLDVLGLWLEDGFDPAEPGFATALAEALRAHLAFGELAKVRFPRTRRHAALVRAVKAEL